MEEEKKIFGLYQLMQAVSRQVNQATGGKAFWLKAEISQIQFARSGHCYIDLVEQENGATIAKSKATIWKGQLYSIKKDLQKDFKHILKQGTEIVFLAQVSFSAVYGFTVQIMEIDAGFNLGLLEKRKQETIKKLKESGEIELNKKLKEPIVIQRIALITSEKSAAYEDFMSHLFHDDQQPYRFEVTLFHAQVQGDHAPQQMVEALKRIEPESYDAVALIRGGGSKLDLEAFNDLELAKEVANFPLPVLSGVGHETDLSVIDMLVKSPHKTPTAVADYLVDKCMHFERDVYTLYQNIARLAREFIKKDQLVLERMGESIKKDPVSFCQIKRGKLHQLFQLMERQTSALLSSYRTFLAQSTSNLYERSIEKVKYIEQEKINTIQEKVIRITESKLHQQALKMDSLLSTVDYLKPENTLKRGFSIARLNGKSINNVDKLKKGDAFDVELFDGYLKATVQERKKKKNGKERD